VTSIFIHVPHCPTLVKEANTSQTNQKLVNEENEGEGDSSQQVRSFAFACRQESIGGSESGHFHGFGFSNIGIQLLGGTAEFLFLGTLRNKRRFVIHVISWIIEPITSQTQQKQKWLWSDSTGQRQVEIKWLRGRGSLKHADTSEILFSFKLRLESGYSQRDVLIP